MPPSLILRCGQHLNSALTRYRAGDASLAPAVTHILAEADAALHIELINIVGKSVVPPSGDKRDYMSMGPYWWPDPEKPDGLPYIRRDGELNPKSIDSDRAKMTAMVKAVGVLSLAWYFSGNLKYAQRAGELLREFFLDEQRGMNPNLNFGQAIPGHCDGRGIGIIETTIFATELIDSIQLLQTSGGLEATDFNGLRRWFTAYLDWLITSQHGIDESREHNNHGTAYDLQVAVFARFVGREAQIRETLNAVGQKRIVPHVASNGEQPHELARTRAMSYATMNLQLLFDLAALAARFDIDLYGPMAEDGRSLQRALDWLVPYWTQEQPFPYPQIVPFQFEAADKLLRQASWAYGEPAYETATQKLPIPPKTAGQLPSRLFFPPRPE